jgi:hypothetical protein
MRKLEIHIKLWLENLMGRHIWETVYRREDNIKMIWIGLVLDRVKHWAFMNTAMIHCFPYKHGISSRLWSSAM